MLRDESRVKTADETEKQQRSDQDSAHEGSDEEDGAHVADAAQPPALRGSHLQKWESLGSSRTRPQAAVPGHGKQHANIGATRRRRRQSESAVAPPTWTIAHVNQHAAVLVTFPLPIHRRGRPLHSPISRPVKQSHTTLHISLSTNDYGAVPIYCMTIEAFFASALSALGLEGKETDVAAVTGRLDWLRDDGPMMVRTQVRDSFQKVLETIAEAPVWGGGGADGVAERRGCDVRVRIHMMGG